MKKPSVLKAIKVLLPLCFKTSPFLFIATQVCMIIHGLSWGVLTLVQQRFFDSATGYAAGTATLSAIVMALLLFGIANVVCQVLNGVGNYIPMMHGELCEGRLTNKIYKKIPRLSPIDFEDTKRLDDINKSTQGVSHAVMFTMGFTVIFSFYIPYFAFMGWYLFTLKPVLAWSILIVFLPNIITMLVRASVFAKLEDTSAPVRRENEYYENCIGSREYFKETRLLGGYKYFMRLFAETVELMNKLKLKANIKSNLIEFAMKSLTVIGYSFILWMLFDALMQKEITVGAFAAVFASIGALYAIMDEVICRHIGNMAQNMGLIQNYISFLELPERPTQSDEPTSDGSIVLEHVDFAYPNADKNALTDITLTVRNGETVAIVGENGSGKSTLIRLLTGLYMPTAGTIKHAAPIYTQTSGVFQKYSRYQMKLADNIRISDTDHNMQLDNICEQAGFSKDDPVFTDGYDTMLSREFDGVDISGGQWQRIAIARGYYRKQSRPSKNGVRSLIVLDEPTAAIDPIEETRIYENFAQLAKDNTAVIVTHRLGSVRIADRIIVMKDGRIAETGTHNDLIELNGEYARMYASQQQWYAAV